MLSTLYGDIRFLFLSFASKFRLLARVILVHLVHVFQRLLIAWTFVLSSLLYPNPSMWAARNGLGDRPLHPPRRDGAPEDQGPRAESFLLGAHGGVRRHRHEEAPPAPGPGGG